MTFVTSTQTLVLDAGWQPVARVPWQRALTLVFSGKVEVVERYEDRTARSVTLEVRLPSVVRFFRSAGRGHKRIRFSRQNVYARDGGRCQYCSRALTRREATYDHVTPRAQGGLTNWQNIVIACVPCNQHKGGRTPAQAKMRLRKAPLRPEWLPPSMQLAVGWEAGMPPSWQTFLRDVAYWHGALDSDD